jgi:hypothetical protein
VVNEKGAERAIATGAVRTLGYPCSISENFLRRNQKQSLEENHAVLERIRARADDAGLGMVVYISMAFGNPYGEYAQGFVFVDFNLSDTGVRTIFDTTLLEIPGLPNEWHGTSLGTVSDWSGDGADDLVIGAHRFISAKVRKKPSSVRRRGIARRPRAR